MAVGADAPAAEVHGVIELISPSATCGSREKEGNMNIYVGNLSFEVTEDELRKEFMTYGNVTSVTIMNDKYIGSGQPRAYGYVEMSLKSEGTTAIASLQGKRLRNRAVKVVEALPLSDKNPAKSGTVNEKIRSNKCRTRKFRAS
jgi:RNA recognition motif-containing protein